MSKVTVKVIGAYVDGYAPGNDIEIDKRSADHLEKIGYVKRVEAEKAEPKDADKPKSKSKPKKKVKQTKPEDK
ncbi:hypothetical protein [Rossellomorea marisflavi]|uniref:hypothetical protein n=1 Tax=Rossellomorea marisflavi TaxID=189381 RepID=UPI0009A75EA6|nr:hypothetical protein [Rossellomorea marisflavi]